MGGNSQHQRIRAVLTSLRRKLGSLKSLPDGSDPLRQMIYYILQEDSSAEKAQHAMAAIERLTVDWNEARMLSWPEVTELLQSTGEEGLSERVERLRVLLVRLFQDHNDVSMRPLLEADLETRTRYLVSLDALRPEVTQAFLYLTLREDEDYRPTTEFYRVMRRLGFLATSSQRAAAKLLHKHFRGRFDGAEFLGQIERLARLRCHARGPRCGSCPLTERCVTGRKTLGRTRRRAAGPSGRARAHKAAASR